MKPKIRPEESLEEIVFRSRNKSYGAYELRRKYQKYTLVSLLFALFIIGSAIVYPVVAAYLNRHYYAGGTSGNYEPMPPPPPATPDAPPPPPPPPPAAVQQRSFTTPVVAPIDSVEVPLPINDEINNRPNAAPPADEPIPEDIGTKKKEEVIETPDLPPPVKWAPVMAEFPGGYGAMMEFFQKNVKVPEDVTELGIQGIVYLYFVVERDGSVTNLRIARGISAGCDEEALRVARLMPKWTPASNNGTPVRLEFSLPVKFSVK